MAKKRASARKKSGRTRRAKRTSKAKRVTGARPATLEEWLENIRRLDSEVEDADGLERADTSRGACLVKEPRTGQSYCIRTTKDACAAMKGSFIGGPCGQ